MVSALFSLPAGRNVGTGVPCGLYNQAETQNKEPEAAKPYSAEAAKPYSAAYTRAVT